MFCTQCGFNNRDDAKFCKSCGKPLDVSRVQTDTQKPVQQSMQQYAQAGRKQTAPVVNKAPVKAKANGGGFLKKIVLVAAAVTAGGVVISQFGNDGGGGTVTPTVGSTIATGSQTTGTKNTDTSKENNTDKKNANSNGVPAGAYVYNSANLYLAPADDVDREAVYSALQEITLNIGADGSFSGYGVSEIPLGDYSKNEQEATESREGYVYENSIIGSVKAEVSVSGNIDSDGNGNCTFTLLVNHDYDKQEIQTNFDYKHTYKDTFRQGRSEHFRYEYTGTGKVDTPDPSKFTSNGIIIHPDGELVRTGESYWTQGPVTKEEVKADGSVETKNGEQTVSYDISGQGQESYDLGFMAAWSNSEETGQYITTGTRNH